MGETLVNQLKNSSLIWYILQVLIGVLITITLAVSGYTLKKMIDLETRIVRIESTAPTARDTLEIWQAINKIKQDVTRLSSETPQWVVDRVAANEVKIDRIDCRVRDLEQQ